MFRNCVPTDPRLTDPDDPEEGTRLKPYGPASGVVDGKKLASVARILVSVRGASPLGLPYTRSRAPLRRRAPIAWLARTARSHLGVRVRFMRQLLVFYLLEAL